MALDHTRPHPFGFEPRTNWVYTGHMNQESSSDQQASTVAETGVLLINNSEQVPADSHAYRVAVEIAAAKGVPVTLYDRSEETWGDSQHPEGPMRAGDDLLSERPDLLNQITWLNEQGATGQGWVSTLPSISAVLSALAEIGADVVVVPDTLSRKILERALEGGSLAESLAEQVSRNPDVDAVVIGVDDDGDATIIAPD